MRTISTQLDKYLSGEERATHLRVDIDTVGDGVANDFQDFGDYLDEDWLLSAEWSEDLNDLERASRDLDLRVAALRCDPAAIQQRALDEANLGVEIGDALREVVHLVDDVVGAVGDAVG